MAWGCAAWGSRIALAFLHHFTDFMEQRETACRVNPPQLIITVHYNTAYPITWLSSVELLWVDPSRKNGQKLVNA